MKKKIAKKRAKALGNMGNIGGNKSRNMCHNSNFLCLQENRMRRSPKRNRKQMYDQQKRIYSLLFEKKLLKN